MRKKSFKQEQQEYLELQTKTNGLIALVTQKLNIDIRQDGTMYLVTDDNEVHQLRMDGRNIVSTFVVGTNIDPETQIAFDPYNNVRMAIAMVNAYLELYLPDREIIGISLSTRHMNQKGFAEIKFMDGEVIRSHEYKQDGLKYMDLIYNLDGSVPPEYAKLRELDMECEK